MAINYVLQRNWLNLKRHKLTLFVSIPIFAFMMAIIGSIYSDSLVNGIVTIPTFKALLGNIQVPNPNMLVWFLIYTNIFILIFPAVGIFLGIRMLPFNERDGKELIFSVKMSPVKYFFENFILVLILIPLTVSPVFIVAVLFLGATSDSITAMAIATITPSFFVLLITMITVFGATYKSSSGWGYAFGGLIYMFFFALNLIVSEQAVGSLSVDVFGMHIISLQDISLMSQMNIFTDALKGTWNVDYLLTCTVLVVILVLFSLVFLFRTDYIESRTSSVVATQTNDSVTKKKFTSRFSFFRTPVDSILKKVGWKYPALRDQLQSSSAFFLIYTVATTFLVIIVLLAYPGDASKRTLFGSLASVKDNPVIAGFMFGHPVSAANNANLEGFILFKLFTLHWLYYGPFLFIATYYIVMRDKSNKYDEITWSLPQTRTSVLLSRTFAMILYFWITIFINWIGIWIGWVILKTYMVVTMPDPLNTLITFFFLALGYSLFLILFLAVAIFVNSRYIIISLAGLFIFSIFMPMISFSLAQANVPDASWLEYLSPFKYFDIVGLMLKDINIVNVVIPTITIGGIIALLFYYYSVKFVNPRKDIT